MCGHGESSSVGWDHYVNRLESWRFHSFNSLWGVTRASKNAVLTVVLYQLLLCR